MLRASPTFRRQCRRLARERSLHVWAQWDVRLGGGPFRARSVIDRTASGMMASVSIGTRGAPYEWIAHEFEHLIEQLDGVRLGDTAASWRTDAEAFETERAIRAGRAVLAEMSGETAGASAEE